MVNLKYLMNSWLERLRLNRDIRKLKKKTYQIIHDLGDEYSKGKNGNMDPYWDKFNDSVKDIENYTKIKIRERKIKTIKNKLK